MTDTQRSGVSASALRRHSNKSCGATPYAGWRRSSIVNLLFLLVGLFCTGISFSPATAASVTTQQTAPAAVSTQQPQGSPSLNPNQDRFFFVIANPNTIDPEKFIFNIKAGSAAQDYVYIKNGADVPLTFSLYGADGTQTAQGSFALKTKNQPMSQVGSWITFDQSSITLQPGQYQKLGFTVAVPANTPSGLYSGGVAAEKSRPDTSNPNVTIAVRIALRVDVNVNGTPQPVPKKFADPQDNGYLAFYFWASVVVFLISAVTLIWSFKQDKKASKWPHKR